MQRTYRSRGVSFHYEEDAQVPLSSADLRQPSRQDTTTYIDNIVEASIRNGCANAHFELQLILQNKMHLQNLRVADDLAGEWLEKVQCEQSLAPLLLLHIYKISKSISREAGSLVEGGVFKQCRQICDEKANKLERLDLGRMGPAFVVNKQESAGPVVPKLF